MDTWDRSKDWVLIRSWIDQAHVTIRFGNDRPTVQELIALRRTLPQFRDMASSEVRRTIGDTGSFDLGIMPTQAAVDLVALGKQNGLNVTSEDASYARYLPFDRASRCALLIENDEEAAQVKREMLAVGIPVVESKHFAKEQGN